MYGYLPPKKSLSIEQIEMKLKQFGLEQYEVELIVRRILDGQGLAEIVDEQGWTNKNSANYFLRKALTKLRKGGFTLR